MTKNHFPSILTASLLAIVSLTPARSAATSRGEAATWVGERGVTETVNGIMARQATFKRAVPRPILPRLSANRRGLQVAFDSPFVQGWPSVSAEAWRAVPKARRDAPQSAGLSFNGPTIADTPGYTPPDAMGAAGPTQFVVTVNGRFRTYNKATGVADGALDVDPDVFFASVLTTGVPYNGTTDPRVRFDRLTNRWFITMIDIPTNSSSVSVNNRVLIAVSSGPTITAQSSFTFFYFQQNTVSPAGDTDYFADYPTLGIDANALYIGANMYTGGGSFRSTTGWVVRKASILGTGPIVVKAFRGLATGTDTTLNPGPYTPQGVDNDDPNATEGYFIGVDNQSYGVLVVRRVSTPGGTPTISGNLNITVPSTAGPITVSPLGTTCPLDTGDDRLYSAQIKKNPLTGERTLWTAHNIGVDNSGVAAPDPAIPSMVGTRWYELYNLTTTPALKQSGTLYDSSGNKRSYTFPAIAASGQGHIALTCSTMGPTERTGIALTGRLNGDTAGTLQSVTMAPVTASAYNYETCGGGTTYQRWGDYGYTCVDPTDDMTLWTVQEYAFALNAWAVRVIRLQAPPPASPSSCAPNTVALGTTNTNVVLTGTSTSGSGFFDPGAGFANRLSATVSGSGVTVNNVTYNSPTQITLNLTVAAGAGSGVRTITVTNPDGQSVTSAAILTITGVPYTALDVTNALKIAAGIVSATSANVARYDIVSGNAVSITDATQILRKVMGLVTNP